MTSKFGQLGEIDPSQDNWKSYSKCLDFYLNANNVADVQKKRSVLLSSSTYKLIRSLCSPNSPIDKTYKEIIELVSNHYRLTPSIVVERLNFQFINPMSQFPPS